MSEKDNSRYIKVKINGMHCASCEVLIERKLKKIPGVENVNVSLAKGEVELSSSRDITIKEIEDVVNDDTYKAYLDEKTASKNSSYIAFKKSDIKRGVFLIILLGFYFMLKQFNILPSFGVYEAVSYGLVFILGLIALTSIQPSSRKYGHIELKKGHIEIGAFFIIIIALYLILKQFNILPSFGVSDTMGYGLVFVLGLIAATSTCLAVTGGLLLAVGARYTEQHPELTGYQRFKPHISFNIGRLISYTILGGLIGLLGSILTFSSEVTGVITIIVSLIMVVIGLQMLKIFPFLNRFQFKMPKFFAHKIYDVNSKSGKAAPFLFGAGTFFLPCGFTQALQLYVLAKGSFVTGALTMLAFSLGTMPALVSLGAISSFFKGTIQKRLMRFAAVLVILLAIFNIGNGLILTGATTSLTNSKTIDVKAIDPNVKLLDGKQIVSMKVAGLDYYPNQITVSKGVPVEWEIDGSGARGCAKVINVPKLNIREYLPAQGTKTISFTPEQTGKIPFSCSMGMTYGEFVVN